MPEEVLHIRRIKMKKLNFLTFLTIVGICLVFSGCSSLIKAKTLDTSVSLEEQAQIRIDKVLNLTSIDDKSIPTLKKSLGDDYVVNIPAGKHTVIFTHRYSLIPVEITFNFEAGILYDAFINENSKFIIYKWGYAEYYKPNQEETLIVLRRKNGDVLFGAGNLGIINVVVDEKTMYRTWAGHTVSILLPKGKHQLNIGGKKITIDAGGGTKKFFTISRSSFMNLKVKETQK
jgi:hypothetical protein